MRSPICWFGGKGLLVKKLLPLIPAHHIYVEVFGGGASLLLAKPPELSKVEIYNDLDHRLYNLFATLRDPAQFAIFERLANLTPYSRETFNHCIDPTIPRNPTLKGKVLLSGYPNPIYQPLEATWHTHQWQVTCSAAGRTRTSGLIGKGKVTQQQQRTEAVWYNYPTPQPVTTTTPPLQGTVLP